jgi:hypothetical protein
MVKMSKMTTKIVVTIGNKSVNLDFTAEGDLMKEEANFLRFTQDICEYLLVEDGEVYRMAWKGKKYQI